MADAGDFNKKVHLLWLGIGTAEGQRMYDSIRNYHDALTKAGIRHVYYESPGTSHEWLTWRPLPARVRSAAVCQGGGARRRGPRPQERARGRGSSAVPLC